MEDKGFYRKEIAKLFKGEVYSKKYRKEAEERVCSQIVNSEEFNNAGYVFLYMSLPDEFNVQTIMEKSFELNKKVLLPRIIEDTNRMDFYLVESKNFENQMKTGSYNIIEPTEINKKIDFAAIEENTFVVVPGRAFTLDGKRLGRGKGFYDLFLSTMKKSSKNFVCGVCYDFQILEDLPVNQFDVKMDKVYC